MALNMKINVHLLSKIRFRHTYVMALLISCLIVAVTATLARATLNLSGALTHKPDIAVLLLLPEEGIWESTLVRAATNERSYLVETRTGPKLVRLKKGTEEWYVGEVVVLHGDSGTEIPTAQDTL